MNEGMSDEAFRVAIHIARKQTTEPETFGCGSLERFQDPYRAILSMTCDLIQLRISAAEYEAKLAPYLQDDAVRTWLRDVFGIRV